MMSVLRLLGGAVLAMSLVPLARAAEEFLDFNLPMAPLDRALEAFGRISKEQLLLDASITDGRQSSPVVGRFTPEAALRQMVSGSGLVVRAVEGQGFAIVPASTANISASSREVPLSSAQRFESYSATIQIALGRVLCERVDTVPGAYRTMARLWIGASGMVDRAQLLTSSGDADRDALLKARFRGLAIGAPPTGLPQPITLLVTSEGASADYCAKIGAIPGNAVDIR
ncbi:MAG TPA: STN domain-containing protein [Afipia sp.]